MAIKTPRQGKPTQNTDLILNVSKIPYGKNGWWKKLLEPSPWMARFYGYYDTSTVWL
jgi:hypothetical protein